MREKLYLIHVWLFVLTIQCCGVFQNNYNGIPAVEEETDNTIYLQYFIPDTSGYVYFTDEHYLWLLYNKSSCEIDYKSFIKQIQNDGSNYNYTTTFFNPSTKEFGTFKYYYRKFKTDSIVFADYVSLDFKEFTAKYCTNSEGTLYFSQPYSLDKRLTIANCFCKNGYYYEFGNTSGMECFEKLDSLLSKGFKIEIGEGK